MDDEYRHFNPKVTLERCVNDKNLVIDLINIFFSSSKERLGRLEDAINNKNASEISLEAHSLKSSCLNFGAKKAAELAKEIEKSSSENDFSKINSLLLCIKEEISEITTELIKFKEFLKS